MAGFEPQNFDVGSDRFATTPALLLLCFIKKWANPGLFLFIPHLFHMNTI